MSCPALKVMVSVIIKSQYGFSLAKSFLPRFILELGLYKLPSRK